MSIDEKIAVMTDLLHRLQTASSNPSKPHSSPMTYEDIASDMDSAFERSESDESRMRVYISKLEEAVRRVRSELSPATAQRCFDDLDAWLKQHHWLDFVRHSEG